MHDCDWSGDGELSSGLGELSGVDADELWNFISAVGSGDPEDTLLKIEVIVSVPFSVAFCGACESNHAVYRYIVISVTFILSCTQCVYDLTIYVFMN